KDSQLYKTVVHMDSILFRAYNECDMAIQADIFDEDLEFYHDQGGLSTDKEALLESIKRNICGKVTRELVEGSIEVHPIEGFGAVELGLHRFHNIEEPNVEPRESKFIIIWKQAKDQWKISRVISLH